MLFPYVSDYRVSLVEQLELDMIHPNFNEPVNVFSEEIYQWV